MSSSEWQPWATIRKTPDCQCVECSAGFLDGSAECFHHADNLNDIPAEEARLKLLRQVADGRIERLYIFRNPE